MRLRKTVSLTGIFLVSYFFGITQNFDISLLKSINKNESGFKNKFFKTTAQSVTVISIAVPAGVLVAGLIRHDKKLQKDAAWMAGGYIFSALVTQGMKRIIQRDRPFVTYPFIIKRDAGGGYAFPSGHSSAAFCAAASLGMLFPKWYVIVPSYLYAAAAGYSRMYQGVHYPTDIFAGAVVGAGCAWFSFKVEKWVNKKYAIKRAAIPAAL
jgi:membrane-associated phospholipid phosphatase